MNRCFIGGCWNRHRWSCLLLHWNWNDTMDHIIDSREKFCDSTFLNGCNVPNLEEVLSVLGVYYFLRLAGLICFKFGLHFLNLSSVACTSSCRNQPCILTLQYNSAMMQFNSCSHWNMLLSLLPLWNNPVAIVQQAPMVVTIICSQHSIQYHLLH